MKKFTFLGLSLGSVLAIGWTSSIFQSSPDSLFVSEESKRNSPLQKPLWRISQNTLKDLQNTDTKVSGQKFLALGPPEGRKNSTISKKKSIFLTWLNIQHYLREARNGRNFCQTPNFWTFTIFQLSYKKIISEIFLGQKLCHGVKSRLNPWVTFWEEFFPENGSKM